MADDHKDFAILNTVFARADLRELVRTTDGEQPALPERVKLRLNGLCAAFLADDNDSRHQVITQMLKIGITAPEIIDYIVPVLASLMGQRWADDELSFVDVAIGTARLQEVVRALVARGTSHGFDVTGAETTGPERAHARRVLMVVPRSEDHTLGVFVAADQFRRFGYDVDIAVDQHPKQIAATLKRQHYSMVGLTIAGRRTLASTRELVDTIRSAAARVTPIVLGGSLIATEQDLKTATGADHVVQSVRDALDICGLSIVESDPPRDKVTSH